jgi:hypothetical protein
MVMGRPKTALVLGAGLREQLESLANSRSLPAGLVRRAKHYFAERFGEDQRGDCAAAGDDQGAVGLWRNSRPRDRTSAGLVR